ncbi:MAG TPA: hypothetical protein VFC78_04070 [Tepidisphaeraceae bacterium]|nr:hypothetical protein [Tepidisphaeraceae bacterium]
MNHRCFRSFLCCLLACGVGGCMVFKPVNPKAAPATAVDAKLANSEYWFNLPAVEHVKANNFDLLWDACRRAAITSSFEIDRTDYRLGLMTTKPLVSRQFFEFWKGDVADGRSELDSNEATRRRVVHFEIHKSKGGGYVCEPKVVVEHYAMPERRITSVTQYLDVFSITRPLSSQTTDEGQPMRIEYWYAERRDNAMEHKLAKKLRSYLKPR